MVPQPAHPPRQVARQALHSTRRRPQRPSWSQPRLCCPGQCRLAQGAAVSGPALATSASQIAGAAQREHRAPHAETAAHPKSVLHRGPQRHAPAVAAAHSGRSADCKALPPERRPRPHAPTELPPTAHPPGLAFPRARCRRRAARRPGRAVAVASPVQVPRNGCCSGHPLVAPGPRDARFAPTPATQHSKQVRRQPRQFSRLTPLEDPKPR